MGTHAIMKKKKKKAKMVDKKIVLQSDIISSVKEISAAISDVLYACNYLASAVSKVKVASCTIVQLLHSHCQE